MNTSQQIAKNFREVFFGGNWTDSSLKKQVETIDWKQATTKVYDFNTITTLVFHMTYYVTAALQVLKGQPLVAKDKYSFDHPPINSEKDWQQFLEKIWLEAEEFALLIEQLSDKKLMDHFSDEKYGTYYRNLHGIIEHTHYHLGQLVLLKKIVANNQNPSE